MIWLYVLWTSEGDYVMCFFVYPCIFDPLRTSACPYVADLNRA